MPRTIICPWFTKDYPYKNIPDNCALVVDRPYFLVPDISNIYIQVEPKIIMDVDDYLIQHYKVYSHIYTYSENVLRTCPNARKYVFGTAWVKPPIYNNIDMGRKKFQISNIAGTKKINNAPGHIVRQVIHYSQEKLRAKYPITFFRSERQKPHIKDFGENPLLGEEKDALFLDYQYAIVVENSRQANYFTEKLVDCLLTKTIPIYYGAPNIGTYFDTRGWILLETGSIGELMEKLAALEESYYMHYRDVVEENWQRAVGFSRLDVNIDNAVVPVLGSA
jgi:hypothetical protein